MLETLDYTIRIGSTPTFLYFVLYSEDVILKIQYFDFISKSSSDRGNIQCYCIFNVVVGMLLYIFTLSEDALENEVEISVSHV